MMLNQRRETTTFYFCSSSSHLSKSETISNGKGNYFISNSRIDQGSTFNWEQIGSILLKTSSLFSKFSTIWRTSSWKDKSFLSLDLQGIFCFWKYFCIRFWITVCSWFCYKYLRKVNQFSGVLSSSICYLLKDLVILKLSMFNSLSSSLSEY